MRVRAYASGAFAKISAKIFVVVLQFYNSTFQLVVEADNPKKLMAHVQRVIALHMKMENYRSAIDESKRLIEICKDNQVSDIFQFTFSLSKRRSNGL